MAFEGILQLQSYLELLLLQCFSHLLKCHFFAIFQVDSNLSEQISLNAEQDIYHGVISTCLGLLVQELEASCDPALNTMIKIPWYNILF